MDPYRILGVARDCTRDDVKAAFRAKVWNAHPDRGGDEQAFIELCAAYKRLLKIVPSTRRGRKEPAEVAVGDAPDTPEETPRSSRALFCRKSSTAMRGIKELWGDITRLNYAAGILVFVALILWGLLVCVALLPEPKPEAPDAEQFRAELAKRREYLKSLKDKPTSQR